MSVRQGGYQHHQRPAHARRQASVDYPKYAPLRSTTQQQPITLSEVALMPAHIPVSDYEVESDALEGYISDLPRPAPPVARTNDELNLSVIQKHYPDVVEILSVAPYATIYDFSPSTNEWQKTSQVGTLFICQLAPGTYGELRYRAIVLNRGGMDNFEAGLLQLDHGGVAIQGEFVEIIGESEDGETKVNSIYIYSAEGQSTEASRKANGELMVELARVARTSREAAERQAHRSHEQESETVTTPVVAPQARKEVDLLALLQGARSDTETERVLQPPKPPETQANTLLDLFKNSGAKI